MIKEIEITTAFIKLDAFLKFAGEYPTGGGAKESILDGKVLVNGEVCLQRGRKLKVGDRVESGGSIYVVTES